VDAVPGEVCGSGRGHQPVDQHREALIVVQREVVFGQVDLQRHAEFLTVVQLPRIAAALVFLQRRDLPDTAPGQVRRDRVMTLGDFAIGRAHGKDNLAKLQAFGPDIGT